MVFSIYRVALFFLVIPAALAWADLKNGGSCIQRQAKLTFQMETVTTGTIELILHAESIYELKKMAATKRARKARENALKSLMANPSKLFRLPADCKVKLEKKEDLQAGEENESTGIDVSADPDTALFFSVSCEISLLGAKFWVGVFDILPRVKSILIQVTSPTGEAEAKITDGRTAIVIP